MKTWIRRLSAGLTRDTLSDAIFSGQILYFENLAPMGRVVDEACRLVNEALAPHNPERAHQDLEPSEYRKRFASAQGAYRSSKIIRQELEAALISAGLDPSDTFADKFMLRVSPPEMRSYERSGFGAIPPHRDSWGSALLSQINWWFPVFPLSEDRTMAIFPAHWAAKVDNDADSWDWRRAGKDAGTPLLPTAQGVIDRSGEIRLMVEPGTLVAFSAAHLHASIPNTTSLARFSSETRTVDIRDVISGRGAPDIDGLGVCAAYSWFRRIGNGERLSQALDKV